MRYAALSLVLSQANCGDSTDGEDDSNLSTTGGGGSSSSSSDGGESSSGAAESSSSGAADTTGGESSDSTGTTGVVEGCGDGEQEPGELCIGEVVDTYEMGADARALVVADFNADGRGDFATMDSIGPALDLRLSDGDRSYGELMSWPVGASTFDIQAGDFDYDGDVDVVAFGDDLTIFQNVAGELSPVEVPAAGLFTDQFNAGTLGEFNNVLGLDVVHTGSNFVHYQRGQAGPDGWTFDAAIPLPIATKGASGIASTIFTWDDDEFADVVVLNRNLEFAQVLLAGGAGQFTFETNVDVCPEDSGAFKITIADLNGDDLQDLLTTCTAGAWSVVLATGPGEFAEPVVQNLDAAFHPGYADIDADGDIDVAVTQSSMGRVEIFLNDGTGTMEFAQPLQGFGDAFAFELQDMDGDGSVDGTIALSTTNGGTVEVHWANP